MLESKLDPWLKPAEEKESNAANPPHGESTATTPIPEEEAQAAPKKKKAVLELLKEEIVGDVKVVMRRHAKLKYIEVRAYDLGPKHTIESRGFAQYLPPWKNEFVDGPKLANEYFTALVAWFRGGRQGNILPFRYSEGPWHEGGT